MKDAEPTISPTKAWVVPATQTKATLVAETLEFWVSVAPAGNCEGAGAMLTYHTLPWIR